MITHSELTPAQEKWLALIEYYFEDVYSSGKITHKQLKAAHDRFTVLRKEDKKYKVGWPIWLITNNAISRGVYELPVPSGTVKVEEDPDINHPFYPEYIAELKRFNVIE